MNWGSWTHPSSVWIPHPSWQTRSRTIQNPLAKASFPRKTARKAPGLRPGCPLSMSRRRSLSKARRYRQHGPKHSDCTSHYIRYDTLYWIHRFKNDQEPSKTGGSWSFLAPALPEIRSGTHVTIWLRRKGDFLGAVKIYAQNCLQAPAE